MSTPSLEYPRRDLAFRDGNAGFCLILKRNCSISPVALAGAFAALAAVVLAIATGFAIAGAWLVLPFAGLEVGALVVAYLLYARHAADYERIELRAGRLTVEVADAANTSRFEIDVRRASVRLERGEGYGARVVLRGLQEELEIGRHLDADTRVAFAAELEKRLRI